MYYYNFHFPGATSACVISGGREKACRRSSTSDSESEKLFGHVPQPTFHVLFGNQYETKQNNSFTKSVTSTRTFDISANGYQSVLACTRSTIEGAHHSIGKGSVVNDRTFSRRPISRIVFPRRNRTATPDSYNAAAF